MAKNIRDYIQERILILDGAMGTMLQASGLKMGETPEALNLQKPELLVDIHRKYVEAGSDIIYANTFGANRFKLHKCGYSVEEVIPAAIANAKKACEGTDTLVALDIGPIGQLLEPTGTLTFEEAYDVFRQQVLAGKDADVIIRALYRSRKEDLQAAGIIISEDELLELYGY